MDIYVEEGQNAEELIEKADREGLKTPGFMSVLSSFEGYLMVYRDTKLAWTAKLN